MFDNNLLPEFESIKDDNEEILWIDKPKFIPFLMTGMGSLLFVLPFGIIWILTSRNAKGENGEPTPSYFWLFGLIPIVLGVWSFLQKILSYGNTSYAYSNRRVMMRTGFFGTDFKTIDYDKISDSEVTVNFIERMYNVGTIRFHAGRTESDSDGNISKMYDTWEAIQNPYEVYKKIKQITVDIKTDYNYPNALRPDNNPGYNTKYQKD
jgi:Bacterial PH domain